MIAGVLNDKGLNDSGVMFAKIGNQLIPVLPYVIPFLDKIEKGTSVEYNEKDGKITKISKVKIMGSTRSKAEIAKEQEDYNAKAAKAGFVLPGKQDTCTSPEKPAPDIERINRESEEHGKKLQAEIAARKASQNPAPITQLVPSHPVQVPVVSFSNDQINLIKATVARGCTDTEFELLMYLSAQYGLDPIRRQIWAVKYGTAPASIFTGRDGFLEIAHRSGQFDGMESGVKTVREGENDELIGWCKVYRKDMSHAFYVEVYEREYTTGKSLWQTKPRIMIQKVAESSCLRRAFSVSGLYCPEEIDTGVQQ